MISQSVEQIMDVDHGSGRVRVSADDLSDVMIDTMSAKQIVTTYLILQAGGTLAWWMLLLLVPASVAWFHPAEWRPESLIAFWLGDFVLLVFGSLFTAVVIFRETSIATISIWALTAAVWYPTLYCIGVSLMTDEAWIASAMMGSMAGLTFAMATIHGNENQKSATIRVTPMTKTAAAGWTFAQTMLFWSLFLWILPKGIVEIEHRLGWQSFSHDFQSIGSVCLFVAASALGLSSGMIMATRGLGTPLPTATAPRLVVVGPYRFVRNPMAVAGILQGIAVGWFLGSFSVIAYAITGAFVWHIFVRPVEEADLRSRFGDSYSNYRKSVRLWVPKFGSAYSQPEHHEI